MLLSQKEWQFAYHSRMFGRGILKMISQTSDTQHFVNTNIQSGINDIQISLSTRTSCQTCGTTIGEPHTSGGIWVAGAEKNVGPNGDATSGRGSDTGSADGIEGR